MTYYYVAVAAIFVGFYSGNCDVSSKFWLLILGYIVSILWHLSCKGYYFWVKHWTAQLLKIENLNNYDVYSVFSESVKTNDDKILNPLKSANISTSKVTLLFSFSIAVTWGFLIFNQTFMDCDIELFKGLILLLLALIITIFMVYILGKFLKSDLTKHKMV